MRALLVKDLRLLKNQGKSYLYIVLFMTAFLLLASESMKGFAGVYLPLVFSMFSVSTFSYDESNNGMAYLMSLPFGRRAYVTEKCLFGLLMMGISGILEVVVYLIILRNVEMLIGAVAALVVLYLFFCIQLLCMVRFSAEKGRMVGSGIFFVLFMAIVLAINGFKEEAVSFFDSLDAMWASALPTVLIAVPVIMLVSIILCWLIAVRIMEKKEF